MSKNSNFFKHSKAHNIFVRCVWLYAVVNAIQYLLYSGLLLMGAADIPVDESMSRPLVLFGCVLLSALPFLGLWLGSNFNLAQMVDGYHKGSELSWSLLVLVYLLTMSKIYYEQMLPTF